MQCILCAVKNQTASNAWLLLLFPNALFFSPPFHSSSMNCSLLLSILLNVLEQEMWVSVTLWSVYLGFLFTIFFFKVSSKYFFSTCYWNEMRCSWSVCICFFLAALPKRLGGGKCRASLRVFGNCQWVIPRQKELQNYFWSGPMSSHIHYFEV